MEEKDLGKTSSGIQANVAGLLCYVLGWVTGLIFFLIEKENKFVRFHALQSMIVFGALFVLSFAIGMFTGMFGAMGLHFLIPLFALVNVLLALAGFILWILLMVKAYQGEKFKLPVAGDIAEKNTQ
jgi:uncharacterized membrane protein